MLKDERTPEIKSEQTTRPKHSKRKRNNRDDNKTKVDQQKTDRPNSEEKKRTTCRLLLFSCSFVFVFGCVYLNCFIWKLHKVLGSQQCVSSQCLFWVFFLSVEPPPTPARCPPHTTTLCSHLFYVFVFFVNCCLLFFVFFAFHEQLNVFFQQLCKTAIFHYPVN